MYMLSIAARYLGYFYPGLVGAMVCGVHKIGSGKAGLDNTPVQPFHGMSLQENCLCANSSQWLFTYEEFGGSSEWACLPGLWSGAKTSMYNAIVLQI